MLCFVESSSSRFHVATFIKYIMVCCFQPPVYYIRLVCLLCIENKPIIDFTGAVRYFIFIKGIVQFMDIVAAFVIFDSVLNKSAVNTNKLS